ncbi:Acetylornithine deacetylase/Succinyl-diaminopimelate desuccinylase [Maribacter orientalis]|uniref:Acetylornithine deacetylase/Succinyl-diaminopimelate desuccinylase n=1 Tax=Maribacter orientalis TaxID=228957 RepID=A0A1H7V5L5_9FLAO|nr:M20/M25/M40 family metallo-hydrolase [Maribacter orientalis]SEM04349.1 Acetylornithine deacetylase/Succinyl-diaminopimelate desuccinylase [Maribacter orientalis]|tara:strand:- start:118 stop:1422 length:1305 start_codon:yes stop_codon:yes gene_type:complete
MRRLNNFSDKIIVMVLVFIFSITNNVYGQDALKTNKKIDKELAKLLKDKSIKSAFEYIDAIEEETNKNLIELTEIAAPPFLEGERAKALEKMFVDAGVDNVSIDEVGNVVALKKGTEGGKVIALDAHLDTVFPEGTSVNVQQRGDTLFAPGIGDDTRGLAMLLTIFKAMKNSNIKTKADIWFVATVGEEGLGDLRGVKHLFRNGAPKIDSWISIDGGSIGRVNNAGLGSVRYKALFTGKGGHSWGAFGLANPHHALGYAIKEFSVNAKKYTDEGPKTSFNIGRMGGGTSVNSIPFESWMEVDMRSVDKDRLVEIDSLFKASMQTALEEYNNSGIDDKISLELIKIGDRPSGELSIDTPLVQRAISATTLFGATPSLTRGSTNSNIPISLGIPAITIGRGGIGGGAHSLNEWWLNKNGAEAIKLALLLTVSEAGY